MTRRFPLILSVALAAGAVLAASASPLGAADVFKARMLTGRAPVEPPMVNVQIEVNGWTTQDEIIGLQKVFNERGMDAFLDAFSQLDKGVVRFMYTRGFNMPIHGAVSVPTEKGRKVFLFFNRLQYDAGSQRPMGRYLFMVIELNLNEKGRGEGRFYQDAQIRLEPQNGTLVLETYEGTPKLFPQVGQVIKKTEDKK